jgi:hypothetical protein
MVYFRNDNEEYISWIERHPEAYVLNVHTGGKQRAMLHRSRCSHLYEPDPTLAHTVTYPKACSRSRDELERWATEAGLTLTFCPDCQP